MRTFDPNPSIRPLSLVPWVLAFLSSAALVTLCALAARV